MATRGFTAPILFTLLVLCSTVLARQQDQSGDQQQPKPPTLNKPSDQKPPTLGGDGEAPSLAGPHSANTNDPGRLLRVHSIFIDPMDNGLAEKLVGEIGAHGPFRIASSRQEADAVLRGTCFDSTRLKTVHSEVFLTSRGGEAIWQDIVRQPYKPPPLARAVGTTAQVIVADLAASVREAHAK
ncbi:MAG TPA: hypothetical protein VG206_05140 [Terriglobia bacterium]|nr:hypothetical protein [Terriglobia bacterium]